MPHPAFEEFVAFLNSRKARYLIVGAYAVAHHGYPRATGDLDVWVEPSAENAPRVLAALSDLYSGYDFGVTADQLSSAAKILTVGEQPTQIDVITSISGVGSFAKAWGRADHGVFGRAPATYLSLEDLVSAKAAVVNNPGREDKSDVRDLRLLRAALERAKSAAKRKVRPRRRRGR